MKVAVVGAGMAGLACAEQLSGAGHTVVLFDKGRAPGGRMSTRRMPTSAGDAFFDHGAQYFTVRDAGFRARVARWHAAGLVAPWPDAGAEAWVGTPAMNAPVRQMAAGLDVRWSVTVGAISGRAGEWRLAGAGVDDVGFDAVIVAIPAEQAATLLRPIDAAMADTATATPSLPCWTVMAAFAERLPIATDILREDVAIGWAARNSAKPGRSGPESWVIQASPDWSRGHLEEAADAILPALLNAFAARAKIDVPTPLAAAAHRWRYARAGSDGAGLLWNPGKRLGVCGDWLLGPRVECAWLSGDRLGEAVVAGRL